MEKITKFRNQSCRFLSGVTVSTYTSICVVPLGQTILSVMQDDRKFFLLVALSKNKSASVFGILAVIDRVKGQKYSALFVK